MKPPSQDIEPSLRTIRWRSPSPEFLQRTLEAALIERQAAEDSTKRRAPMGIIPAFVQGIPRLLRWPLAACWLLSLAFKLATPDPVSPAYRQSMAGMPSIDTATLLAQISSRQRLAGQMADAILRPRPGLSTPRNPGKQILP